MPRLYLELIENKAKVKQDLINKEYVPSTALPKESSPKLDFVENAQKSKNHGKVRRRERKNRSQSNDTDDSDNLDNYKPTKRFGNSSDNFENRLDRLLSGDDSDDFDDESIGGKFQEAISPSSSISALSIKEEKGGNGYSSDDSNDLSVRLKELLNEDSNSEASYGKFEKSIARSKAPSTVDKYSRHRDKYGHSVAHPGANSYAPTLAELEARGGYVPRKELRDINQTTMNEQHEDDAKRELLFKFDLLRKSYPTAIIPDYNIHTDLHTMQKSYSDCVRRLSLDSSVESYKTYLVYGFMGCEFVFGNFLGFDMQGFTQQQILSMNSYEKLLIELGEKSYVPTGSRWPIELRLLFMIIMNAAFFVISKMIMKKTGSNLMGMINNMNSTPQATAAPPQRKRRMRGPNIDLGDIPDIRSASPVA